MYRVGEQNLLVKLKKVDMKTKDEIIEILKTIKDPELDLDIWTLGLVYEIKIESDELINFVITYTSPMCPFGPEINRKIQDEMRYAGFKHTNIKVVFEPAWKPSDELRESLGV